MLNTVPGYTVNPKPIYSGLYTIIFSGIKDNNHSNVVIKILKNEYPSPDEIARFKHEYEIAKIFEHEKDIVHVSDLERYENSYAIIMENINNPSLADILEKEKKITLIQFLDLAIAATQALAHIHQNNIIHKDINPSNIMYNLAKNELKIIDFGLSANLPKERAEIVSPNVLEGTLAYLSPEQTGRMNRGIDYRTDYYSLGVTFYQALTGKLPFESKEPLELVHYHIAVVPQTPHEIDNSIPQAVSNIIMKMLSKKAEDRYQNANGLLADLNNCRDQLHNTEKIDLFPLGTQDIFSRFQIPEKLYGREHEITKLLEAYDQITKGNINLMLVSGYSGIGKSALVHEIHKPIVKKHGYFISGKFDQFKHNIPYAAVTEALEEFVKQILTEPDDRITMFRNKVLNAVEDNGQVIVEVIPSLIKLIGTQPAVLELGPTESQNRFSYVFQNFIKALAKAEHPLAIFLDDLQWADTPSLKLIETLLTSSDCSYLIIIGAYRSNEVTPAHPLMLTLEELKKRNVEYSTIELGPLQLEHVTSLLSDTLHQTKDEVNSLSNICYEKTSGNPFFLIQLLITLYKEQLIEFDINKNKWTWNLQNIKEKGITDNVVYLMINKIRELSPETQKDLQYAACIGNKFNLDLLAYISNKKPEQILIELQEALQEGYIISHGDAYRAVLYEFAHDRIQQAANELIPKEELPQIHIKLARILINKTSKDKLDDIIFDIANHYNIAIDKIISSIDENEKHQIAEINLQASKTSKLAAAFEPALQYAENGIKCTNESMWDSDYQFMFDLYSEATETSYLSSKYDLTEKYAAESLKHTRTDPHRLAIIQTQVYSNVSQMKQSVAVNLVRDTLEQLGIHLPKKPSLFHILTAVIKTKFLLFGKRIPDLLFLPEMTDLTKKAIIRLITSVISSAYQANPNMLPLFVCTNVALSLRYGNTLGSAYSYTFYGVISCTKLGEIDNGYQFGELAIKLTDKLNDEEGKTKVIFANYAFIKHWKDPLLEALPKAIENFKRGLDDGDLEYGCYSISLSIMYGYFAAKPLEDLITRSGPYISYMDKLQQIVNSNFLSIVRQAMLNLFQVRQDPDLLQGESFDELKTVPICVQANDRTALCLIYFHKLILHFLFDRTDQLTNYIEESDKYIESLLGFIFVPVQNFYKALSFLRLYSMTNSKIKKINYLKAVKTIERKFKKWAYFSPSNHLHKYLLIQAEILWHVYKNTEKAAKLYDQAIELAKKNEYLNEEAIANELAAKFYLAQGNEKFGKLYIIDARHCYLLWGAKAKVAQLDEKYSQLLTKLRTEISVSGIPTTVSTSSSDRTVSNMLDLNTIQKSSQAISSTIVLSDLLKRLMSIVIENAGAQKSYLLLKKQKNYVIEAEGNVEQKEPKVLQSIEISPNILPISIINYVIHAKESVVLDNAIKSEQFMNDSYIIDKQPKSILCMPLLNQGKLSGILYMENNLTEAAFTKDRIDVLNLLSSQIAISIDNARLYSNTKKLNEKLIILNQAYERFVPQDFLSLLEKKSIVDVDLGDHVQETMSVLFTDIRNFTTRSEKMTPQENFNFINSFLSCIGPIIRKHHGFVDKYIGDAIMALYPRKPDDALQCALEMQSALREYNKLHSDQEPVQIGIGINTGLLMLGTVGEANRMNATVISDAVNIASRIESLTKTYQAPILISEDTFKHLTNPARYQIEMADDKVLAKGKTKTIAIYKVIEQ